MAASVSWELDESVDDYGEASFEAFEEEDVLSLSSSQTSPKPSRSSPLAKEQPLAPHSQQQQKRLPSVPLEPSLRSSSPRNSSFTASPHSMDHVTLGAKTSPRTTRTTATSTPSVSSSAPSPGSVGSGSGGPRRKKNQVFFPDDDIEIHAGATPSTGLPKQRLTMDELRASMMDTLTRQGVVGSLRAQLRARMVSNLKQTAIQGGVLGSQDRGPLETNAARRGSVPLRLRVVDTFLAEYLKAQRLEYTLSIFLTESSLSSSPALGVDDALRLLRVESNTMLFQRLTEVRPRGSATIVRLLDHVKRTQGAGRRSSSCQTETTSNTPASERLYERLAELEHGFKVQATATAATSGSSRSGVEERMIQYQKECDERAQQEVEERMEEFRRGQLADYERNERARYVSIITAERTNLKKEYERQTNTLKDRHERRQGAAERAQKELDRVAFDQRQRHLDAMKRVSGREDELRRQAEVEKRALEVERSRILDMERELRAKLDTASTARINRQRLWSEQMDA